MSQRSHRNPRHLPYAPDGLSSTDRNQEKEQCGWEHNTHNTNHNEDLTSLPFELKTNKFHDRTPSGTMPAGIPIIPSIPNTNSTTIYPKDLGDPLNVPDGTSREMTTRQPKTEGSGSAPHMR